MPLRAFLAMLAFLAATTVTAAESASSITGRTTDDGGRPLPGVTVRIEGLDPRLSRSVSTDTTGAYEIIGLPAGRYQVAFRLPGFATSTRTVQLDAGAAARVDAVLRVTFTADVLVTSRLTFRNLTDLDEPVNGLLGLAAAGSDGVVTSRMIEERPVFRAGEVFEAVPGVVITQHSGEGKANQYYVRGFNIDHGTDLATFVAGVPVNMPTHGHGQGYSTTTSRTFRASLAASF